SGDASNAPQESFTLIGFPHINDFGPCEFQNPLCVIELSDSESRQSIGVQSGVRTGGLRNRELVRGEALSDTSHILVKLRTREEWLHQHQCVHPARVVRDFLQGRHSLEKGSCSGSRLETAVYEARYTASSEPLHSFRPPARSTVTVGFGGPR